MRTFRILSVLVLCALLPSAATAGGTSASDPAGDQSLRQSAVAVPSPACSDSRTDLTGLSASSDATQLVLTISVDDVGGGVACGGIGVDHENNAAFGASLVPESGPYSLEFHAEYGTLLATRCALVETAAPHARAPCAATGIRSGDAVTWTVPLSGLAKFGGRAPVAYDLSGTDWTVRATGETPLAGRLALVDELAAPTLST